MLVYKNLFDI